MSEEAHKTKQLPNPECLHECHNDARYMHTVCVDCVRVKFWQVYLKEMLCFRNSYPRPRMKSYSCFAWVSSYWSLLPLGRIKACCLTSTSLCISMSLITQLSDYPCFNHVYLNNQLSILFQDTVAYLLLLLFTFTLVIMVNFIPIKRDLGWCSSCFHGSKLLFPGE